MNFSGALQLLAGVLAASMAVESFAPSTLLQSAVYRLPSTLLYRNDLSAADIDGAAYALGIPPMPQSSCGISPYHDTETLDEEMDSFADPNDKRYSASDWFHNMVSLPNSSILGEIRGPVGWITAWSTLVSVLHAICNRVGLGHFSQKMCLGSTPHSLIASSVGLLLVFRTNASYQRFTVSFSMHESIIDLCNHDKL